VKAEAIFKAAECVASDAPFIVVPFADLAHSEPPPQAFWWHDYMPAGVVTLLGAHGGTGKSFLAIQLAVSVALGLPLFGVPTKRGSVAIFSGEDDADVLRRRLHHVCRAMRVSIADLAGRLHILDATAGDPSLYRETTEGGRRGGMTTPGYEALAGFVESNAIDVLIVDNASDTFDASENDRARVRAFMRTLTQIARPHRAVMLLVHVDKGTSRGDRNGSESYSGSTAWHNSARSRLFLSRDKDGALLLEHQKANHTAQREPVHLLWPTGGVMHVDEPVNGFVQRIADGANTKAVLKLIHEFSERGEWVSTATTSRTHAGKLLRGQSGFPQRLPDAELFDLLRTAERKGLIERCVFRPKGSGKHEREAWRVTAKGEAAAAITAKSADSADSADFRSQHHPAPGADSADFGNGGCGGNARTEVGTEPDPADAPDDADSEVGAVESAQ